MRLRNGGVGNKVYGVGRRATGDVKAKRYNGVTAQRLLCGCVPFRPYGTRMLVTYYVTAQFCGSASLC